MIVYRENTLQALLAVPLGALRFAATPGLLMLPDTFNLSFLLLLILITLMENISQQQSSALLRHEFLAKLKRRHCTRQMLTVSALQAGFNNDAST